MQTQRHNRPTPPTWRRNLLITTAIGALGLAASLIAGCGSSSTSSNRGASLAGQPSASRGVGAAQAAVAAAQRRDVQPPDSSSRPAVRGKTIAIITLSGASESGSVPDDAAMAAAQALGWKATIYDAHIDVGAITGLIRQALAAGAQGIIATNIDCDLAKQGFAEAKAKGVPVVAITGYDCNDPFSPAGPGPQLFGGSVKYGGAITPDQFYLQDGQDVANAAIADSGNTAKIIEVEDLTLAAERLQEKGFDDTIAHSRGSQIVDKLIFTPPDFASGKLLTMVESALAQHPEATYIKSPFTGVTVADIEPAVRASHSSIKVLGGEGLTSELDLLRAGKLLATDATPAGWYGWAAIDTLNSLFQHKPPADSRLQYLLVTKKNVTPSGLFTTKVNFQAAYRKAWGVG